MAAKVHLSIALVILVFLFSVKGFQDRELNHEYSWYPENSILMTDNSEENMEENLQKFKQCCFHKLDRLTSFAARPGKRGGKAALLDMVDYVTAPDSVAGGVKPKGQFTRAWKTILTNQN